MEYSKVVLERAKMAVEIGQAILEGKHIDVESNGDWITESTPSLNFVINTYRVKAEPKYVPFTFEDAKDLIGRVVKRKINDFICMVTSIDNEDNVFLGGQASYDFKDNDLL